MPALGWVGTAIGLSFLAWAAPRVWGFLMRAIADRIVATIGDKLEVRWKEALEDALDPIYAELQIGEGAEKWPNGSDTLPKTMKTIYDRQAETYGMVRDMQRQLEQVLTSRPPRPDDPVGTPEGF